jgi:hypothetical protein
MVRQCGLGVMQSKLLLVIELMTIETKKLLVLASWQRNGMSVSDRIIFALDKGQIR